MNILKSIAAVLAGIIFIVITHSLTDLVLESVGIFPQPSEGLHVTWMLVLATGYRTVYNIGGGFVTALLAPSRPIAHVTVLGLIGLTVSTIAAIVAIPMDLSPAWYPIALAVMALPSVFLGGKIAAQRGR